jgi:hypothetical protein
MGDHHASVLLVGCATGFALIWLAAAFTPDPHTATIAASLVLLAFVVGACFGVAYDRLGRD